MHVWTNGDGILLDSNGVILCDECPCDLAFCPAVKYSAQVDCQDHLLTKQFTMDVPKIGSGSYFGTKTIDGTDESPPPNTNEWEVTLTATCIDGYVIGVNIVFRNNPSPAYQFAYDGGGTALPTPLPSSDTGWIELTNRNPAFAGDKCLIRLTS